MFHDFPNRRVHFSFPFRISFNNILSLQAIDQYCQDVFRNMHFEAYWNPKGMVSCPVDLKNNISRYLPRNNKTLMNLTMGIGSTKSNVVNEFT
jgi:hypothetical protein